MAYRKHEEHVYLNRPCSLDGSSAHFLNPLFHRPFPIPHPNDIPHSRLYSLKSLSDKLTGR